MAEVDFSDIDMEELEKKTKELGAHYEDLYVGCAQASFSTVADILRQECGIELVDEETEETMFTGKVGLAGGVGLSGLGTCGAIEGASTAISLATGIGREEQETAGPEERLKPYNNVYKYIVKPSLENYNGLTCREVQWAKFDTAWNMVGPLPSSEEVDPEAFEEFHANENEVCKNDQGETLPEKCTIPRVAWWAVKGILEIK